MYKGTSVVLDELDSQISDMVDVRNTCSKTWWYYNFNIGEAEYINLESGCGVVRSCLDEV